MNLPSVKGLRQFLNSKQQRAWLEAQAPSLDAPDRSESLEHRFKYAARFEKLLRRPQARDVLDILRLYGETCIPIPRTTERWYWSVSCLPSTSDKPLVRVNASWMELFTLLPNGDALRARFIVHLSDFTKDGSPEPDDLDHNFLGDASSCQRTSPTHSGGARTSSSSRFAVPPRSAPFLRTPERSAQSATSTSPT